MANHGYAATRLEVLYTGNVDRKTFGKLFSLIVDGQVYAQPLYGYLLLN